MVAIGARGHDGSAAADRENEGALYFVPLVREPYVAAPPVRTSSFRCSPCLGNVAFRWQTPGQAPTLRIVDLRGREVRRVALTWDEGEWTWDGRDDDGARLSRGRYVGLLEHAHERASVSVLLY
jgi:hypothetical protein